MVDSATYNQLSADEQKEFWSLNKKFIAAVLATGIGDGYVFGQEYKVVSSGGKHFISNDGKTAFADITSSSFAVIDALRTDAVQNYGR